MKNTEKNTNKDTKKIKMLKKISIGSIGSAMIMIAVGIVLLLMPGTALTTIVRIFGLLLLLTGGIRLFGWYKNKNAKDAEPVPAAAFGGSIIAAVAGLLLLINPGFVVSIFPMFAGLVILLNGIMQLMRAIRAKKSGEATGNVVLILPVISIVLGALIFFDPFSAAANLVRVIGIILIYNGVTGLIVDFKKKKEAKETQTVLPK